MNECVLPFAEICRTIGPLSLAAASSRALKVPLHVIPPAWCPTSVLFDMEWRRKDRSAVLVQAGHALIGALMPEYDPVAKISIVPRGAAGGLTFFSPSEERLESGLYRCGVLSRVHQLSFKALRGLPRLCGFWLPSQAQLCYV